MISEKPYKNFLAERRVKAGLSQSELARFAGISAASVNRYEKGSRAMSRSTMIKIADVLGCKTYDLFQPLESKQG